jgi:hypothetical protein
MSWLNYSLSAEMWIILYYFCSGYDYNDYYSRRQYYDRQYYDYYYGNYGQGYYDEHGYYHADPAAQRLVYATKLSLYIYVHYDQ